MSALSPLLRLLSAVLAGGLLLSGCQEDGDPGPDPDPIDNVTPDEVTGVQLRPTDVAIDLESILTLKTHVRAEDGGVYDIPDEQLIFQVDDPGIAAVDADGRVIPLRTGSVAVTATWEGMTSEPAVVRIVTPGAVRVTVVDVETGAALPAASVWVGDRPAVGPWFTAGDGSVDIQGDFSGALTVTADFEGYRRTSVVGTVAREVRLALRSDGQEAPPATFRGTVDFTSEPGTGELALALSIATIPGTPLLANLVDFIGNLIDVDAFGLQTQLPENMVVSGVLDHFVAPAWPGERRVVTLGGVFDISTLLTLVVDVQEYGPGAVFNVLGQHSQDLLLGASEVVTLEEGETLNDVEVTAEVPLLRETHMTIGPPPDGDFPDPATILALRESEGAGYAVVGLGIGVNAYAEPGGDDDSSGDDDDATFDDDRFFARDAPWEMVAVHEAQTEGTGAFEGPTTRYLASVFEGGLGAGLRSSIVLSTDISDPDFTLPAFLDLPEPYIPTEDDVADGALFFSADRGATVQVLTLAAGDKWWDFWCDGWKDSVIVPEGLPPLAGEEIYWRYWLHNSYGILAASFDSLANEADEGFADLLPLLQRRTDALIFWEDVLFP